MLSITPMSGGRYFRTHVAESRDAAKARGYFMKSIDAGEPPGVLYGVGLRHVGLEAGGTVSNELMETLFTKLLDPDTHERLGSAERHYAGRAENLAKAAERKGVALPDRLKPKAVRAAVEAVAQVYRGEVTRTVEAEIRALSPDPETFADVKRLAAKNGRKERTLYDFTFSADKSWSVVQVAFESIGDDERVAIVEDCWRAGMLAVLDEVQRLPGLARKGRNGIEHVDADGIVAAIFAHHLSREGDPQLHFHATVANRVRLPDGTWLAIDGALLMRERPRLAALGERVAEEALTRRLGVRFAYDPKSKARHIVGVPTELMELFSKRSVAIDARLDEWAERFKARTGEEPNEKQRDAASRRIARTNRKAKTDIPTTERRLEGLAKEIKEARLDGLHEVVKAVDKERKERPVVVDAVAINEDALADQAVREVLALRGTGFHRQHVTIEVGRQLPDDHRGRSVREVDELLERITDKAMSRSLVATATPPDPFADVPPELRRGTDGASIFSAYRDQLFVSAETLSQEQRLLSRALQVGAPKVDPAAARLHAEKVQLFDDQADAMVGTVSGGHVLSVLIGPAGTGKSRTVGAISEVWQGKVIGLTESQQAAEVLKAEGLANAVNIDAWFSALERLRSRKNVRPGDRKLALSKGCLVIVDEASMADTADIARICELVSGVDGKVLLVGDHHQLEAIESAGLLRLLAEDRRVQLAGSVRELTTVARFSAEWEKAASSRLRVGDASVLDIYDAHGRIEDGAGAEMARKALEASFVDVRMGRQGLLLAPTNKMAAAMALRVRAERVKAGLVDDGLVVEIGAHDCVAGRGDLIQCRKNAWDLRDSKGRIVVNRSTAEVLQVTKDGGLIVRRDLGRDKSGDVIWSKPIELPASYVGRHVELAYASTVHAAQGRTVDVCRSLVGSQMSQEAIYVAATRARYLNMLYVDTDVPEVEALIDDDAPEGRSGVEVLTQAVERSDATLTATEATRAEFDRAESLARLGPMWESLCGAANEARHREALDRAAGAEFAALVAGDQAAPAFWNAVEDARLAGYDVDKTLRVVVHERDFDDAESVAHVLRWRIHGYTDEHAPDFAPTARRTDTYVERTPEPQGLSTPNLAGNDGRLALARQLAGAMDARIDALGHKAIEEERVWVATLPPVPDGPDYEARRARQAGLVAGYREQYVPDRAEDEPDPIGPAPPRTISANRYHDWRLANDALGNPDRTRDVSVQTDRELYGTIIEWGERLDEAPKYVADELRSARQELERMERAHVRAEKVPGFEPGQHHRLMGEEIKARSGRLEQLDEDQAKREAWNRENEAERQKAEDARLELQRRHPDRNVDELVKTEEQRLAELTPAQRRREERQRQQSGRSDDIGLSIRL